MSCEYQARQRAEQVSAEVGAGLVGVPCLAARWEGRVPTKEEMCQEIAEWLSAGTSEDATTIAALLARLPDPQLGLSDLSRDYPLEDVRWRLEQMWPPDVAYGPLARTLGMTWPTDGVAVERAIQVTQKVRERLWALNRPPDDERRSRLAALAEARDAAWAEVQALQAHPEGDSEREQALERWRSAGEALEPLQRDVEREEKVRRAGWAALGLNPRLTVVQEPGESQATSSSLTDLGSRADRRPLTRQLVVDDAEAFAEGRGGSARLEVHQPDYGIQQSFLLDGSKPLQEVAQEIEEWYSSARTEVLAQQDLGTYRAQVAALAEPQEASDAAWGRALHEWSQVFHDLTTTLLRRPEAALQTLHSEIAQRIALWHDQQARPEVVRRLEAFAAYQPWQRDEARQHAVESYYQEVVRHIENTEGLSEASRAEFKARCTQVRQQLLAAQDEAGVRTDL